MPWRCVFNRETGAAISFGTDVDATLLEGQDAVPVEGPPTEELMWDPATLGMVARPPKMPREPITKP